MFHPFKYQVKEEAKITSKPLKTPKIVGIILVSLLLAATVIFAVASPFVFYILAYNFKKTESILSDCLKTVKGGLTSLANPLFEPSESKSTLTNLHQCLLDKEEGAKKFGCLLISGKTKVETRNAFAVYFTL